MFSLIQGLIQWLFSKNELHVLMLGLDNAGKTTLLEQGKQAFRKTGSHGGGAIPLDRIPPTVGLNIARMDIGSNRILVWDLGGLASLRSIWTKYYDDSHAIIFVVDSSSRLDEAKVALHTLLETPALEHIPFMLCVNKQDLKNVLSPTDVDLELSFSDTCTRQERPHRTQALSALMGRGVEETFRWVAEAAALVMRQ
jgi:ADP-ribosylation factor related protein 1